MATLSSPSTEEDEISSNISGKSSFVTPERRREVTANDYDWTDVELLGKSRCTKCAEVVKVRRRRDCKTVAIRRISSPVFVVPKDAFDAFEEAQRLLSLPYHRNLVTISAIFRHEQFLCIETDYYEATLNQKIQKHFELRGAFPQSQLVRYALQLTQAVRFLHEHNILHRDLRPKNIYLVGESIKLGDYGAPKIYQNRSHGSRYAGAFWWAEHNYNAGPKHCCLSPVSSWAYMPPEVMCELYRPKTVANTHLKGKNGDHYTVRSDEAWSIGVILYEMLTLKIPFQGRTPKQVQKSIINANLPLQEIPSVRKYIAKLTELPIRILRDSPEERMSLPDLEKQLDELNQRAEVLKLAKYGDAGKLEALLEKNGNPNVSDSPGFTPLMLAAALGHVDVVGVLLKNGADTRPRSKQGWTLEDCITDDLNADDPDLQFMMSDMVNYSQTRR